jgi:predicted lipid-binding transport protein (Tim44 family)
VKYFLYMLIALFTLPLVVIDAEAKRFGGARNIGKQREAISPQAPKAPAQQQQAASGTPAQQPAGASKWLGPLAGLAMGAGLAALFLNNGPAGVLAGLLLIAAIIALAVFAMRTLRARAASGPLRYAGADPHHSALPASTTSFGGAATGAPVAAGSHWPAGFNAEEFARHAKLNFVRLQAVHDARDLAALRDVLTPGMYAAIEADIQAAGDTTPQKTDVVTLNSEVLDVTEENGLYVVSVRFSGLISESESEPPQDFSETWHLEKPVKGRSGWLVAGIQQD